MRVIILSRMMTVEDPAIVIGDLEANVPRDYLKQSLYFIVSAATLLFVVLLLVL
jgi:hypothetical protein